MSLPVCPDWKCAELNAVTATYCYLCGKSLVPSAATYATLRQPAHPSPDLVAAMLERVKR